MNKESIKWLVEHSASIYEAETKVTDKIRDRINSILSLAITPCLGISVYLFSSLRGDIFSPNNILYFWPFFSASMLSLIAAITYTAYTLLPKFKYSRPPSPLEIVKYFEEHPDPTTTLQDGQLGLINEYSESIEHNFKLNESRKYKLLLAQRFAFASFCFLIICIPRWVYNFTQNEIKAQPIRVVSPIQVKEFNMSDSSNNQKNFQKSTNQQTTPTSTSPPISAQTKPNFPKSTMVMDSAIQDHPHPNFPKRTLSLESIDSSKDNNKKAGK